MFILVLQFEQQGVYVYDSFEGFFPRGKKGYIVLFQTVNFNWEGNVTSKRSLVLGFIFVNVMKEILTPCKKCQVDNSWKCSCSIYAQHHSREGGDAVTKIILLRCNKWQRRALWFHNLNIRLLKHLSVPPFVYEVYGCWVVMTKLLWRFAEPAEHICWDLPCC